ncbi:MAG: hypothetical protein RR242_09095 [Clostridium sp.]
MKLRKRIYTVALTAMMAIGFFQMTAIAATKNKISDIRLELSDHLIRGGAINEEELEFTTKSDEYAITEWQIENNGIIWEGNDIPRVTVRLETGDEKYFSVPREKIRVKGDFATVYSTSREDSQTLLITFNLQPMSKRVGQIEYAYLKDKIATWSPAQGAVAYELYLVRDGDAVGSKKTTTETTYDFGTAMLKDGEYYYRVRGVGGKDSKPGNYLDSEEFYRQVKDGTGTAQKLNNAERPVGTWIQNETGWWWQRQNGTWPANQWEFINNKWYFFNETGYMAKGWVLWKNLWYYLGPDGDMWVNTQTPDGYTVNADGVKVE